MFNKRAMAVLLAAGLTVAGGFHAEEVRAEAFVDENGNLILTEWFADVSEAGDTDMEEPAAGSDQPESAYAVPRAAAEGNGTDSGEALSEETLPDAAYEKWLASLGAYAVYYTDGKLPDQKIYDRETGHLLYDPESPETSVLREYVPEEQNAAAEDMAAEKATAAEDEAAAEAAAAAEDETAAEEAVAADDVAAAEEAVAAEDVAAAEEAVAAEDGAAGDQAAEDAAAAADQAKEAAADEDVTTSEEAAPAGVNEIEERYIIEESEELTEASDSEETADTETEEGGREEQTAEEETGILNELPGDRFALSAISAKSMLAAAAEEASDAEYNETEDASADPDEEEVLAAASAARYASSGTLELVGDTTASYSGLNIASSAASTGENTEVQDDGEDAAHPKTQDEAYAEETGKNASANDPEEEADTESVQNIGQGTQTDASGKGPKTADESPVLPYAAASAASILAAFWAFLGFKRRSE